MIKIKMSAQQASMRDWFLRKVKKGSDTAAGKAAETLADIIRLNITSGYFVSPLGLDAPWPPRSEAYAKRVGRGPGMVDTGALLRSVTVTDLGEGEFEVSVNDPKASWLEYGGFGVRADGTPIPARPFFRPAIHYFEQHGIAETILIEESMGAAAE